MKKILQKVINWILNLLFSLFHLFSSKNPKEETIKKSEKKKQDKNENFSKNEEETDTSPNGTRNLFKEHLQLEQTKLVDKEELEEEIYKTIEKVYQIKRNDLSTSQKEKVKKYTEQIIKDIEKEITKHNLTQKEKIKKVMEEKIKKDFQDKKEIYPIIKETEAIERKEIQEPFFTNSIEKETIETISLTMQNSTIQNKEYKQTQVINTPENLTLAETHSPTLNIETEPTNEKTEEIILPLVVEPLPIMEDEETKEKEIKENPVLESKKEEKKQQVSLEKKENQPVININLSALERENNFLIEEAKKEYTKEDLIDKEYEKIENLLDEKIQNLENLLQKNTSQEQKEKIQKELKKMQDTKEKVMLHKEQDLEELRVSLEESIPENEIEEVLKQLQELAEDEKLEKKKQEFLQLEQKSNKEIEEYKKRKIKEQCKKTLHRLEIPLFLSFPFIKNKHFRKFVKGLFVFKSFSFIKNLLFGPKYVEEEIDLSTIKKGSDALKESISITEKNKMSFANLKTSILQKYPDLLKDPEFINTLNGLELKLNEEYEKLIKQEKVVNKYFDKSQVLIRKRKR